jgi:outer membrane protein OmpA-like peptidoglycan-associated protein
VFFNINKTQIASQKDLVNVKALAQYAKDNSAKLNVTGYADSATGSAEYNQKLSEGRAATVADELVKMGVDRSNISTVGKGGVDELSPVSFNRRATVQVAE